MAIDERRRHELHVRVEEVFGSEPANTLMELLPPVGAEMATKHDLEVMGGSLRIEMANLGSSLRAELHAQTRAMFVAVVTIVPTMSGLTFGLVSTLAR